MIEEIKNVPARNPDGTLVKGAVLNPNGRNGENRKGFAPWAVRVEQLAYKYDTVEKLFALFVENPETGNMKMSKEFLGMNPIDAGIIWQLIGAIIGDDKRLERESFWNRKEGLPKETVKHEGGLTHELDPRLLDIVRKVRSAKSIGDSETTRLAIDGPREPNSTAG